MTTEQAAKQAVATLRDKQAVAELRKQELEEERDACAFDAHVTGGGAMSKLTRVNKAIVELDLELASFAAAIRDGTQRIEIAQGASRQELEHEKAQRALALARDLKDAAAASHAALSQAFGALGAMREVIGQLNGLGCMHPSLALADSALRRSVISSSMIARSFQLGFLSPAERHSVAELSEGWVKAIEAWSETRLSPPSAKAA
jgi:hypothetical protein